MYSIQIYVMIALILIGVSELLKEKGFGTRLIPIFNVAAAVLISLFVFEDKELANIILTGVLTGLSSNGIYDCGKALFKDRNAKG